MCDMACDAPRKVGRPRSAAPMTTVSVRLLDRTYAELYMLARVLDTDVATIIRDTIELRMDVARRAGHIPQ